MNFDDQKTQSLDTFKAGVEQSCSTDEATQSLETLPSEAPKKRTGIGLDWIFGMGFQLHFMGLSST